MKYIYKTFDNISTLKAEFNAWVKSFLDRQDPKDTCSWGTIFYIIGRDVALKFCQIYECRYAERVAKDESLDYGDRLTIIGGYGVDYIAEEEDALQMYQEEFPEGEEKEISIQNITKKLEWAKNIEKNKSW